MFMLMLMLTFICIKYTHNHTITTYTPSAFKPSALDSVRFHTVSVSCWPWSFKRFAAIFWPIKPNPFCVYHYCLCVCIIVFDMLRLVFVWFNCCLCLCQICVKIWLPFWFFFIIEKYYYCITFLLTTNPTFRVLILIVYVNLNLLCV